ncbi:MAG TPA: fibronectin type III domain-containing protein [Acidisarcina sp.]|nr:fibronectin type III domain-containing protein [Acidisarcina sp.]
MIRKPGRDNEKAFRICRATALLVFLAAGVFAGCGMPAAPQAPTLKLPEPPKDLSATRSEDTVQLKWTMPRRSTDNIPLQGKTSVYVWRTNGSGRGDLVGDLALLPGASGTFADKLPPQLQTGPPAILTYTVELQNHLGHSAGRSNQAYSAAGASPSSVRELSGEMTKDGVHLRWKQDVTSAEDAGSNVFRGPNVFRIHRKLLDSAPEKKSSEGSAPEPVTLSLLVKPASGEDRDEALDRSALFGRHYEYWVERVAPVSLNGHSIEVLSGPSNTVQIETKDVFPPNPPQQLAAIAAEGQHGIDLSWSPNTETDLAGYVVYRREDGSQPERVSPAGILLVAPSFRDTSALPGHRYRYSVSALDTSGNESARSAEAEESLPQ